MKLPVKHLLLLVCLAWLCKGLSSCKAPEPVEEPPTDIEILQKYLDIPSAPYNYSQPALPVFYSDHFIKIQDNTPPHNPVTDWGATLGRVLFYDTRLSFNNTISCASCHQQQFGFTDTAVLSKGFNGRFTERHSMALANAAFYMNGRFFWDERSATLEEQVLVPVQDAVEMGMRLDSLEQRLRNTAFYPILFKNAFGSTQISSELAAKALAQFIRSMISYQSKYDEGLALAGNRNKDFPNFTAEENMGKRIFMTNLNVNCFGCHNTDAFITDLPRNNGLKAEYKDKGVYEHTQDAFDIGKFKAPSLKNVALRVNYMHDGSLRGLDAVISHYNSGIQPNVNLDNHLHLNGQPARMNLTVEEIAALKAFLHTLTDHKLITDTKFSSPFR